ncbi:MAG: hypothetical protein ACRECQ_16465 [Burkholderiaceae bacterium]
MKISGVLLVVMMLLAPASPCASQDNLAEPSAQDLLARIDREGSRAVVRDLWAREPSFEHVTRQIETGAPDWLRIATALRPFTDGAAALSLDYALARALPRAPGAILALVDRGFVLDSICTSPFIEAEQGVAEAYAREAIAALMRVDDPSLKPRALKCAEQLRLR